MASFTSCESEIMKILWEYGGQKPSEIQARYPRKIRNAALRFQLKVLLEKGHVTRIRAGKAYYYKAATARKGAFRNMAKRMADIFCRGSAASLIAELIKTEKLDDEEIQVLKELAEAKYAGTIKKKGEE